jgi:hypothetical protein
MENTLLMKIELMESYAKVIKTFSSLCHQYIFTSKLFSSVICTGAILFND